MPSGLQVFDENGNIVLDLTDRLFRYVGSGTITTSNGDVNAHFKSSASVSVPGMSMDGSWLVQAYANGTEINVCVNSGGFQINASRKSLAVTYDIYRC